MSEISKLEDTKRKYADIIELPHPRSKKHPPMLSTNRAAQFAPFAALTGYDEAISETARITQHKKELDENQKELLDRKFQWIQEKLKGQDSVQIIATYFVEDQKKEGGSYVEEKLCVKKMDLYQGKIVTTDGKEIYLDDISYVDF